MKTLLELKGIHYTLGWDEFHKKRFLMEKKVNTVFIAPKGSPQEV